MTQAKENAAAKLPYHAPELLFHGRFGEMTRVPGHKNPADIPDNPIYDVCDVSPT